MLHFYTTWKRQKTKGFLTFSGAIEMGCWVRMGSAIQTQFCDKCKNLTVELITPTFVKNESLKKLISSRSILLHKCNFLVFEWTSIVFLIMSVLLYHERIYCKVKDITKKTIDVRSSRCPSHQKHQQKLRFLIFNDINFFKVSL